MPEEKGFVAGLFDFAFEATVAKKLVRLLYVLLLLGGGIALVAQVVVGMQQSPAQGLIVLVAGLVAYFLWILLLRLGLELALVLVRIEENLARATRGGN